MLTQTDAAECIAALWCIGPGGQQKLHDVGGIIDHSIEDIHNLMPEALAAEFTFYDGPVGRRCRDWPDMCAYLEEVGFFERDGTTFTTLRVKFRPELAKHFLFEHQIPQAEWQNLASAFYKAVQHHTAEVFAQ